LMVHKNNNSKHAVVASFTFTLSRRWEQCPSTRCGVLASQPTHHETFGQLWSHFFVREKEETVCAPRVELCLWLCVCRERASWHVFCGAVSSFVMMMLNGADGPAAVAATSLVLTARLALVDGALVAPMWPWCLVARRLLRLQHRLRARHQPHRRHLLRRHGLARRAATRLAACLHLAGLLAHGATNAAQDCAKGDASVLLNAVAHDDSGARQVPRNCEAAAGVTTARKEAPTAVEIDLATVEPAEHPAELAAEAKA
jgi:hypothetical protein